MLMELTDAEVRTVEKRRRIHNLKEGVGIVGDVIERRGDLTVTRYYGGHHPQFAVYHGDKMICLCVYRKGAMSLLDFVTNILHSN